MAGNFPEPGLRRAALLRLIPPVLRARDYRLYTAGGRLLDLWQYGGRAVLGHKPAGLLRELKNSAERGLFAPFPSHLEGRFLKALAILFPGYAFEVYPGADPLRNALAGPQGPFRGPFPDPVLGAVTSSAPPLWRPFAELPPPEVFVPVLPVPLAGSPWVLARRGPAGGEFPCGPVSPAALAPAIRAVYDLIAAPRRGAFPRIRRVLESEAGEKWRLRGIYLSLREVPDDEGWEALFRRFLAGGVLIPPDREEPLILPGALSAGEEAALAALLAG
jgi:hypothetical protein